MKPKDVDSFLEEHKSTADEQVYFWKNPLYMRPDIKQEDMTYLKEGLALMGEEKILQVIADEIKGLDDYSANRQVFNIFERELYSELETLMQPDELNLFHNTRLAFFPLSTVEAMCFNKDISSPNKEKLNGNIILINEGMHQCIRLLVKGYLLEIVTEELEQYHQNGSQDYHNAIRFYLTGDPEIPDTFTGITVKKHADQLTNHQALITTMIIKFSALHEFGHIINNDLSPNTALKLSMIQLHGDTPKAHYHSREYKADEYAMNKLCQMASSEKGLWANFFAVYLFFLWLEGVQKIKQPLFNTHPAPKKRAKNLLQFMKKQFPDSAAAYQDSLEWIEGLVEDWELTKPS